MEKHTKASPFAKLWSKSNFPWQINKGVRSFLGKDLYENWDCGPTRNSLCWFLPYVLVFYHMYSKIFVTFPSNAWRVPKSHFCTILWVVKIMNVYDSIYFILLYCQMEKLSSNANVAVSHISQGHHKYWLTLGLLHDLPISLPIVLTAIFRWERTCQPKRRA